MLSGLTSPTSGEAYVRGKKITKNMQTIRQDIGICLQHDVLFHELTVLQHLQIFAAFKGLNYNEIMENSLAMIAEVGLREKANVKVNELSGGMKRKLSLGIALIGNSKVVILDEPTSGQSFVLFFCNNLV